MAAAHNGALYNEGDAEETILESQERRQLASWALPERVLAEYESRGITSMFPWQMECLSNPRVLHGGNLVYSAPTSAGKTLVAEILSIKTVTERKMKVIIILPFVSVVREKMLYLQGLLSSSGIRVEGLMGNHSLPGGFKMVNIAVCTIEKANSLVNRLLEEGTLKDVGTVVVDELHLLGDPFRGYLLELLLTKICYMCTKDSNMKIQIIGMSATLPNLDLLAKWLDAELFKTDFRPVPLREFLKVGSSMYDKDMRLLRDVCPELHLQGDSDHIVHLCLEMIFDGHSCLIFCPTKNWCEKLSQIIAKELRLLGNSGSPMGIKLREQLNSNAIAEVLEQLSKCPVGLDTVLKRTVAFGVAYHHAGLTIEERDIIESSFCSCTVRVLVATSTLSSGVNLPARRVVVRTPVFHGKPLEVQAYRQMIGRAGRMGKDTVGESILVCSKAEQKVAQEIMQADLKPVTSCLGQGSLSSSLKRAILEVVASGVADTPEKVERYTQCTLLAKTNLQLDCPIASCIQFLVDNEFVRLQDTANGATRYVPSPLGRACLAASLPPDEGLELFQELQKARQCFVLENELHIIYLVTPYSVSAQWGNLDWLQILSIWEQLPTSMRRVGELVGVEERFMVRAMRGTLNLGLSKQRHKLSVHRRFYTSLALLELVNEVPLNEVAHKFHCSRGMLQALQQSSATFAGMVTAFCSRLGWGCLEVLVSQFQDRLQFGVHRELCDLMRLDLLNGPRARALFNAGILSLVDLAGADVCDVENALHKAVPFQSSKEIDGETTYDTAQRNQMKTVWVTGREGLTERKAAVLLIKEARVWLQKELGLVDAKWQEEDVVDSGGDQRVDDADAKNLIIAGRCPDGSVSNSVDQETSVVCAVHESPSVAAGTVEVCVHMSTEHDAPCSPTSEEMLQVQMRDVGSSGSVDTPTGTGLIVQPSPNFRSPSLFDDSFVIDTQLCNALDRSKLLCQEDLHEAAGPPGIAGTSNQQEIIDDVITDSFLERAFNTYSCVDPCGQVEAAGSDYCEQVKQVVMNGNQKVVDNTVTTSFLEQAFDATTFRTSCKYARPLSADCCGQMVPSDDAGEPMEVNRNQRTMDDVITESFLDRAFNTCSAFECEQAGTTECVKATPAGTTLAKSGVRKGKKRCLKFYKRKNLSSSSDDDLISCSQDVAMAPPTGASSLLLRRRHKGCASDSNVTPPVNNGVVQSTGDLQWQELHIVDVCGHRKVFDAFCAEVGLHDQVAVAVACERSVKEVCAGIGHRLISRKRRRVTADVQHHVAGIFHYGERAVVGLALSFGNCEAYYLSLESHEQGGGVSSGITIRERLAVVEKLVSARDKEQVLLVLDAKEQYKVLAQCCAIGMEKCTYDPAVADWLLQPEDKQKNLLGLVLKYIPAASCVTEILGQVQGVGSMSLCTASNIPARLRSSLEALLTWHLLQVLQKELAEKGLLKTYREVEMPTVLCLARMELAGIGFCKSEAERLHSLLMQQMSYCEERAYQLAGHTFSLTSPADVSKVLYVELGLKAGKHHKLTTGKDALLCLKELHPLPGVILQWRKLNTIVTKVMFPLLKAGSSERLYGCYVTHTATGRISMHEPNLQNVPRDFDVTSKDGSVMPISIRTAFVPVTGKTFVSADYSQLELRLLAHLSGDAALLQVLRGGGDVFCTIAAHWNKLAECDVSEQLRQRAKQVCYGIIYGIGSKALAEQLEVEEASAADFMDTFKNAHPGVKKYLEEVVQRCRDDGYVQTLCGRRRYLPAINHTNSAIRSQAERQAINSTVQGSAADVAKAGMVAVEEGLQAAFGTCWRMSETAPCLLLHLHDELLYEVPCSLVQETMQVIRHGMEGAAHLLVPLPVKVKCGPSWGSLG